MSEAEKTAPFVDSLKKESYFRKISDRFQIGTPDILGCYKGLFIAIEVKYVDSVPHDGFVPSLSQHGFTKPQIKELTAIESAGGVGVALVICGDRAFWFTVDQINPEGQVNCLRAIENNRVIKKAHGAWDVHPVLEFFYETKSGEDTFR